MSNSNPNHRLPIAYLRFLVYLGFTGHRHARSRVISLKRLLEMGV